MSPELGEAPLSVAFGFAVVGGTRVISVDLADGPPSTFSVELFGEDGSAVAVEPVEVSITGGIAAAAPPLARAIGVGVVDPVTQNFIVDIVAERGRATPFSTRNRYVTLRSLVSGTEDEVLRVGFFEGPPTTLRQVRTPTMSPHWSTHRPGQRHRPTTADRLGCGSLIPD